MDGALPPPLIPTARHDSRIPRTWSRTVGIGWSGITLALVSTGVSSHIIGRPVFWLDDQRWSVVLLGIFAIVVVATTIFTALWAFANRPRVPIFSAAATSVLIVVAIADRHSSPGAAVVEGALALAALLLTGASFIAGRR